MPYGFNIGRKLLTRRNYPVVIEYQSYRRTSRPYGTITFIV